MSRLNEQEKELLSIIEKVKGELTYYASRYRNNGTNGLLLPGTDSAMQKGITLICCLENKTCAYNNNYTEKDPVPIYASHLPKLRWILQGCHGPRRIRVFPYEIFPRKRKTDLVYSRRTD